MPQTLALYFIVFIGGASVLAIEILGTRVLGPFYGVSIFLWSALITVTLAALSLGYAVGGRWADRGARFSGLGLLLTGAGLWLLFLPWMKRPLLELMEPLGLRAAVLVASSVLFFVPLMLLGMLSPYAIRLKAAKLDEVGRTAGNLYAVSTLASVVAALLTGFVLIPNVGVTRLILIVGVLLLFGAVVAFLVDRKGRASVMGALALTLAGGSLAWKTPGDEADPSRGLLSIEQSAYAEIRVAEYKDLRYLLLDGGTHTIIDPDNGNSYHRYTMALDVLKYLYPDQGRMLLVGLGGGAVARSFAHSDWNVDAVEIDPVVVKVAREYFDLQDEDARVFEMDGRAFLSGSDGGYDVIVLDAFGSSSIPFHLLTQEFFELAKSRLAEEGTLALNLETRGWKDVLLQSVTASLSNFDTVLALPTQEPPNTLGNVIVLASDRELALSDTALPHPKDAVSDSYNHYYVLQLNHAWDNQYEPDASLGVVLTDDRSPVDLWAEDINLQARRDLHEYFKDQNLDW